ncbi:uncharacterized protein [Aegilops tauschii subsp. strangulata]|uniref:uncharacterized protein n=1 Tax=Aegilops tauschii subsp. strangulata TaxID=200361 RepID=UPI003CC8D8F1
MASLCWYVLVAAQDKPCHQAAVLVMDLGNWESLQVTGRAGEELDEEEEEELEDGKIEKGTQEEEDEKDELEDGEIEEATREHVEEEEELEDREIEEATQQEEEEELDDGEIVQGISARGGGGTGRWEIVEDIQQEEEEEELEDGQQEEEEEELEDGEIVEGICSVDAILRTPAGMEMPDVIDLRKSQMKEADNDQAERPLYQVLEQKEERTASAGALYRYVLVGAQDKPPSSSSSGPKRVLERVDITIHLDQLDAVHDTLAAKYRELRGEGESAGKRKRRGKIRGEGSKKMDFKF